MDIRTLEKISFEEIYPVYQRIFNGTEDLRGATLRWEMAGVNQKISLGLFHQDKIISFVLNSETNDALHLFLLGTLPEYQGKGYMKRMLDELSYQRLILEVNQENIKAIEFYLKNGFHIGRELITLKGTLNLPEINPRYRYVVKTLFQDERFDLLKLMQPCLENSFETLLQKREYHETHVLYQDEMPVAFAHYTPMTLSLREIGCRHPAQEKLDELFVRMKLNGEHLHIMNLDTGSPELIDYFLARGMKKLSLQLEMIRSG